ncbi:tRNA methyl transferase-like protein [Methanococcoides sp. SA1]|nr:tRNA methyl transferase-like protein [Methanococcoides sp. SA1]
MMNLEKNVMVLASGGIDSTACIHYYLSLGFNVKSFFVNFGQKSFNKECESVQKVSSYYEIELSSIKCDFSNNFSNGEITGRNGFLALTAIMANPNFKGLLSLGIHSGVPYYDCTPAFMDDMNRIIESYTNGQVKLDAPFQNWEKNMVYDYCKNEAVPVNLTYSCENGRIEPCGKCLSCLDRGILDAGQKTEN